jgi:hypothetical protein
VTHLIVDTNTNTNAYPTIIASDTNYSPEFIPNTVTHLSLNDKFPGGIKGCISGNIIDLRLGPKFQGKISPDDILPTVEFLSFGPYYLEDENNQLRDAYPTYFMPSNIRDLLFPGYSKEIKKYRISNSKYFYIYVNFWNCSNEDYHRIYLPTQEKVPCDFTLILCDASKSITFDVHKIILHNNCTYFNKMFKHFTKPSTNSVAIGCPNIYVSYDMIMSFYGQRTNLGNLPEDKHLLESIKCYDYFDANLDIDRSVLDNLEIPDDDQGLLNILSCRYGIECE